MTFLRVCCVTGLAVAATQTLAEEPLPACGEADRTLDDGCWQPLEQNPNCHVWDADPETLGTAAFEGRGHCRHGKLSGTGSVTWEWFENGELQRLTVAGGLSDGKLDGDVVMVWPNGTRGEGRFIDGKQQGIWVLTNEPGTEVGWDLSEGPVVDGKRQGEWKLIDYESDGTVIAEHYGPFVDDTMHGHWVERTHSSEESVLSRSRRAEGAYVKDKRNGRWTEELSFAYFGEVYRHRREGSFVMGVEHGPWVEVTYFVDPGDSGDPAFRDAPEGEAVRDHTRAEGSYADGERNGRWVFVTHPGEVDLLRDGAYASGDSSIRVEGAYSLGELDGNWRSVLTDGVTIVENFADGRRHGAYEARDSDGSLLMAALAENGEVTELKLPGATPPPAAAEGSNASAAVGAFGITFGPGIEQLKSLKCEPGSSLTHALEQLDGRLRDNDALDGWIPGVRNVPKPIGRGAQHYDVLMSPWTGIAGVRTHLRFSSEDACRQEKGRMDGSLREKHAVCRDHRHLADPERRTPVGQCDANGIPTAVVSTRCGTIREVDSEGDVNVRHQLRLTYQVIEPSERDAMIDAWNKASESGAGEFRTGRRAEFEHRPVAEPGMPPDDRRQQLQRGNLERERKRLSEMNRPSFVEAIESEAKGTCKEDEERLVERHHFGIYRRVVANWSPPHGVGDLRAKLLVELEPTGRIVSVAVVESSSHAAFDRSIVAAVNKAGAFEVPAETAMFERCFRKFHVTFTPEYLPR